MGKPTFSMVIFHGYVSHCQRVFRGWSRTKASKGMNHTTMPWSPDAGSMVLEDWQNSAKFIWGECSYMFQHHGSNSDEFWVNKADFRGIFDTPPLWLRQSPPPKRFHRKCCPQNPMVSLIISPLTVLLPRQWSTSDENEHPHADSLYVRKISPSY